MSRPYRPPSAFCGWFNTRTLTVKDHMLRSYIACYATWCFTHVSGFNFHNFQHDSLFPGYYVSTGNAVNRKNTKSDIGKHREVVEKPLYKCISERLMHVVAWYHGTPDRSSGNLGNKYRLARPVTLPNFVALRQNVQNIRYGKGLLPRKVNQSSP